MAGLYVHIPFCRSKCAYCDFYSLPSAVAAADYVEALIVEARLRQHEIPEPFTTLYLGGGTPTLLAPALLEKLIKNLSELYSTGNPFEEATIEANPEDVSAEALTFLQGLGINRISIGVQSFDNSLLNIIGRNHIAEDAHRALELLNANGINYNADLIYGLPDQTPQQWETDLNKLLLFNPPHISAYLLSYEPGTRLYAQLQRGSVTEASEEVSTAMYTQLCRMMHDNGYRHYEISNFAKPGYHARHNSLYWKYLPYLGLGAAAHSFTGTIRRYNPANIKQYITGISTCANRHDAPLPFHDENETIVNRLNDYIITALRTDIGLDLNFVLSTFGATLHQTLYNNIYDWNGRIHIGLEQIDATHIRIAEQQWLTADAILRDLILE